MSFPLLKRWFGGSKEEPPVTVDLRCGGRVSLSDDHGEAVLAVTTPPDDAGHSRALTLPLTAAERAELSQVLVPDPAAS